MSDRTSKIFNGAADALVRTYTDATATPSNLLNTAAYDRLIVYWTCSATDGSGYFLIELSPDGTNWYPCPDEIPAVGMTVNQAGSGVWEPITRPGFAARIKFYKATGTTVTLSSVVVEGKS